MYRLFIFILFITAIPLYAQTCSRIHAESADTTAIRLHIEDRWLAKDKLDHFAASAFLTGLGFFAMRRELDVNDSRAKNSAMVFSFSLGILKEVYDKTSRKGIASLKDLTADAAGIGLGFALLSLSNRR